MDREHHIDQTRRVVFVESTSAMGGVQFSTLYLTERMNRDRWSPLVICPDEGDLTGACRRAKVPTHVISQIPWRSTSISVRGNVRVPNPAAWLWNAFALASAVRKLKNFLAESDPDLLVTKGLSAHFVGGITARRLGIPCVWHVQDFISERWFGIYRRGFGLAARRLPTRIVVDGKAIARQLPRPAQPRIRVVYNGVDTDLFSPRSDGAGVRREFNIPSHHLVVGHLGRVTPWKGQHYLIEAFARIANEAPDVSLLLVGDPVFDNDSYQRSLLNLVAESGLGERIKFAGYRHDTVQVLNAMDVFTFTSVEKDTSPLALLSAMSCGLPVIAFDIEGVRELMKSEDQFLLARVKDTEALAEALSQVISNPDLRKRLGETSRQQAMAQFNLDTYVSRFEEVFREALQTADARCIPKIDSEIQTDSELRELA